MRSLGTVDPVSWEVGQRTGEGRGGGLGPTARVAGDLPGRGGQPAGGRPAGGTETGAAFCFFRSFRLEIHPYTFGETKGAWEGEAVSE